MRLSHRDFDALQLAILELYEFRDAQTFRQAVPVVVLKAIPADYFIWNEFKINAATRVATMVDYVEAPPRVDSEMSLSLERMMFLHPFTDYFLRNARPTALKVSDFLSFTQLRNSALGAEYRVCGVNYNLSVPIKSISHPAAALNVGRSTRDFTERDRLILNLLRPHFDQAHRNARLATDRLAAHAKPLATYELTPREAEIAHWLANGKTNQEIGIILNVSPRTVEKHMEKVLEKLGVENRTAAAVMVSNANGEP